MIMRSVSTDEVEDIHLFHVGLFGPEVGAGSFVVNAGLEASVSVSATVSGSDIVVSIDITGVASSDVPVSSDDDCSVSVSISDSVGHTFASVSVEVS